MSDERYEPPRANLIQPLGLDCPVFTVQQISTGAFLGSPLASAWMMAVNCAAFGRPEGRRTTLFWGVAGTAAILGLSFALPTEMARPLPIAYTLAIRELAKAKQGNEIDEHVRAGGRRRSWWGAVAISIACVALLVLAVFLGALLLTWAGVIG